MTGSVKKSNFLAWGDNALPGAGNIDFTYSGTNYRMSFTNFIKNLGLSGVIQQEGNPLDTPVLDDQGVVKGIRNLSSGSGIAVSIGPQNSVTIEHGFQEDAIGTTLLDDITATSPLFRSLLPGVGVNVAVVGGAIQISAPGVIVASNVVVVNQMSDFPAAVGGVITLADDTGYLVSANLSTADRFVSGKSSVIFGSDRFVASLTYTASGTLFTSSEASFHIKDITLDAPTGTLLDVSSTGPSDIFLFDDITVVSCDSWGTLSGMAGTRFSNITAQDIKTQGVSFTGTIGVLLANAILATVNGGSLFSLGTAVFNSISCVSCFATLAAGTHFLDGLAASGNISAGNLGSVDDCRFFGAGVPLNTISTDDSRWQFAQNSVIPDTRPDGLLSLQSNATNTVIASIGVPVLVAGTWVVESTSQMAGTVGGRLTYGGEKNAMLPITSSVTVSPVSGGTISISAEVAVNGTVISGSKRSASAASGGSSSITIPWQFLFTQGDYIEIFVTNEDSTIDLLVSSAVHRVN